MLVGRMNAHATRELVQRAWSGSIVPALVDYIRIPNKSPNFDPDWERHGHMERAVELVANWCKARPIEGLELEVVRLPGRTPVILMEIPGERDDTVLLYGHLDKQPEMTGWAPGLGPWEPVLKDGKLYGRGGADDGYAAFASLTAIEAVRAEKAPHARCVVLIEACEESGSFDLPFYLEALAERIGSPSLVVCLDSGAGDYERLWSTTSLRGLVNAELHVEILTEGVHSGDASGVVASSFRIARSLLSRLEDETTGELRVRELFADVPPQRLEQARVAADVLGEGIFRKYPFVDGARATSSDLAELVLARTWRPALSITGADGLPKLADAGNVLRPGTSLALSLRVPPTVDAEAAGKRVKALLEADPPYGARVRVELDGPGQGWNAPALAPWLENATAEASRTYFGAEAAYLGEGGSIPFMGMLGAKFPEAQFLITGVLGPRSNAHGPNEFLHLATGMRLTACVAHVLVAHAQR